jgi:gliding motility-associated-like protein
MKTIRISIIFLLLGLGYSSWAQCEVKATVNPTTICEGQSVFFKATGSCNFLMNNDFNNQSLGVGWSSTAANPVFNNPCGPGPNGSHAWVGTTNSPTRTLVTQNYNVSIGGCKVEFYMRYGRVQGSGPCEDPDATNEGVHLQYSTNSGGTWTDFPGAALNPVGINSTTGPFSTTLPGSGGYWTPESSQANQQNSSLYYWHKYSCPVPPIATTTSTKFRWAQLANSSSGWDAWGIDEVEIVCPDSNTVVEWTDPSGAIFSNNFVAGVQYPTTTGWYYIKITDKASGMFAKDSVYITVNSIPTSDFTVSDTSICQNDSVLFTFAGSASAAASYMWDFDGTAVSTMGPHTEKYNQYGVFPVSLTINDKGCISPKTTKNIHVNPMPMLSFFANKFDGCEPLTVNYTNATFPTNTDYYWRFGDGTTSTDVNPIHTYNNDGIYTIQLFGQTTDGCKDSISINNLIKVYPTPVADFTANKMVTSFKDPTFIITNTSQHSFICEWDFGDGNIDTNCLINSHTYSGEGEYSICLTVMSEHGCLDSLCKIFKVVVDEITIPNVITPDGDGYNQYFEIENISKLQSHKLMIYNRWGKKVFESTNYQNDWDGDNLSDGVYFYTLVYTTMLGNEERMEGTVTIMRK